MPQAYGETPLILSDLKTGVYTYSTDTIGTAVDMPEHMTFELEFETDVAETKSGAKRVHSATVVTGGKFKLSAAGLQWDQLVTMCGWTLNSPSAGVESLKGTPGTPLPYFVVAGKLVDSETGDAHVGVVACKLDKPPTWTMSENAEFLVSEMTGRVDIMDGRSFPYIYKHTTAAAIDFDELFA